jgi:hypothetical protein
MSSKQKLFVGGIELNIFRPQSAGISSRRDAVVFFFLHGRNGSADGEEEKARRFVEKVGYFDTKGSKEFILITFVSDYPPSRRRKPLSCNQI